MISYISVAVAALFVSDLTLFSGFGLGTLLMPVFALFSQWKWRSWRRRWSTARTIS